MKQQYRQAISVVIILIVLMLLGVVTGNLARRNAGADQLPLQTSTATVSNVAPVDYDGQDGKSVLDLLKASHKVETSDSSFGTFVKSIDGVESKDNAAWIFYIDNTIGQEGADKAQTQNGQKIEWRYESF